MLEEAGWRVLQVGEKNVRFVCCRVLLIDSK